MKLRILKQIAAALLSALILLAAPSCGFLEMREADPETAPVSDGLLSQSKRPAEQGGATGLQLYTVPEDPKEEPVVTFAFAGDILIDTFIISDAARKAGEGQTYSFLRTVSGVYRNLENADVTVGFDSSAVHPKGDTDPTHRTPSEALGTLSDAGYDLLNTLGWKDDAGVLEQFGISGISTADGGENRFDLTQKGISAAILAVGGSVYPIGSEAVNGQIGRAAEECDIVIVMADWDPGMTSGEQCAAAYYMAEAGADVIVGTGSTIGAVDWLDKTDGTQTLVAYSLGNLLSTSDDSGSLTGGILSFAVDKRTGKAGVRDVVLTPTFTHMEARKREVQVFPLSSYRDDLAEVHFIKGLSAESLISYVRSIVPAVYLPAEYRR